MVKTTSDQFLILFLWSISVYVWQVALSAFDKDADLDVLDHPILNFIYYMLVEILPSALVLFILRKLPPKRMSDQYHPIHWRWSRRIIAGFALPVMVFLILICSGASTWWYCPTNGVGSGGGACIYYLLRDGVHCWEAVLRKLNIISFLIYVCNTFGS